MPREPTYALICYRPEYERLDRCGEREEYQEALFTRFDNLTGEQLAVEIAKFKTDLVSDYDYEVHYFEEIYRDAETEDERDTRLHVERAHLDLAVEIESDQICLQRATAAKAALLAAEAKADARAAAEAEKTKQAEIAYLGVLKARYPGH